MTYFDKMPKRWETNSIKWNKAEIENFSSNRDVKLSLTHYATGEPGILEKLDWSVA